MTPLHLRLATRKSPLALWQAHHTAQRLADFSAQTGQPITTELVHVITRGDVDLESPIVEIGGKGVFVKEVQRAVLDGDADIAVHSAKDLPALTPDGLCVGAALERANPADVLVGATIGTLPFGAVVACGSPRRRLQLLMERPDLQFVDLRGNMAKRLSVLETGDVHAVVVAAAALDRLGIGSPVAEIFTPAQMIPQVGQGIIALEHRADDEACGAVLAALNAPAAATALTAERGFLAELGADCSLPAGAHWYVTDGNIHFGAILGEISPDNTVKFVRQWRVVTPEEDPTVVGRHMAIAVREDFNTGQFGDSSPDIGASPGHGAAL